MLCWGEEGELCVLYLSASFCFPIQNARVYQDTVLTHTKKLSAYRQTRSEIYIDRPSQKPTLTVSNELSSSVSTWLTCTHIHICNDTHFIDSICSSTLSLQERHSFPIKLPRVFISRQYLHIYCRKKFSHIYSLTNLKPLLLKQSSYIW